MEWNAKWDWESLDMFSSKASETPKNWVWGIIEEGDIVADSFNLTATAGGSGGSVSDMGHGSSTKSSISASTGSASKEEMKTSNFTFEAFADLPQDFLKKKELARAELTGTSHSSSEPLMCLKLGKRTYFENSSIAGSNPKVPSSSEIPVSSSATTDTKKIKSSCQSPLIINQRCQVEGCNLDLSLAKEYHRKHRVCESHSKSSKVVIRGLERRFCQQCSRFHNLSEFDEKKRSCRRRLSDHNARRRKPQHETIQFNSTRLCSSVYDERQQMSFMLHNAPLAYSTRPAANNSTWESTCSSKLTFSKGYLFKSHTDRQTYLPPIQLPRATITNIPNHETTRLSPSKGTTTEVFYQGLKEPVFSSNSDAAPDLRRALSLLSSNGWGGSLESGSSATPLASAEYWQASQQYSSDPFMHVLAGNGNGSTNSSHFQEIQLFKAPFETGFYCSSLN
ncbi:hypothetical protein LguiA_032873 [Lonicera macranthoides]